MQVLDYIDIKEFPIKLYTANCNFTTKSDLNWSPPIIGGVKIEGGLNESYTVIGISKSDDGETCFKVNEESWEHKNKFIDDQPNPNGVFTTEEEAIEWSKRTLTD